MMWIPQWFRKDREVISSPIILAKMLYSGTSIIMIHIYIFLFKSFIEGVEVDKKILWLTIIGWLLTSVRSWWLNRTAKRLSVYDDECGKEFKQKVERWGKRNYGDLIPIYLINYPFLIISIYFLVTEIFPFIFNRPLSDIQMYIFALILGYAIDGIWELFKSFPAIFKRH